MHSIQDLFRIEAAVIHFYGLRVTTLSQRTRRHHIAHPRQVCMYLMRKLTRASLSDIAEFFQLRDHTTVLHGVRRIDQFATDDEKRAIMTLTVEVSRAIEARGRIEAEEWQEFKRIIGV